MRVFQNQPLAFSQALLKEKNQGKFIGRFGTTGNIHAGHLTNLRKMRGCCDVLVVSFVYYFPSLFRAISQGTYISEYQDLRSKDVSLLKELDFPVDYVSFDHLDRHIFAAGMENRESIANDPIFNALGEKVQTSDYIKTYVASLMTRPRHELLADVSWISEKDGLPLITTIWMNRNGNYAVCPAVRRPDGALYDSKDFGLPESLNREKYRVGTAAKTSRELLHDGRTAPEIEEEIKCVLGANINLKGSLILDLDTMTNVASIKKNVYFEFVVELGGIRFADAQVMAEDKRVWLPMETF